MNPLAAKIKSQKKKINFFQRYKFLLPLAIIIAL